MQINGKDGQRQHYSVTVHQVIGRRLHVLTRQQLIDGRISDPKWNQGRPDAWLWHSNKVYVKRWALYRFKTWYYTVTVSYIPLTCRVLVLTAFALCALCLQILYKRLQNRHIKHLCVYDNIELRCYIPLNTK